MGWSEVDGLLEDAVSAGVVPGVVGVVGGRDGALYEGAFGRLGPGNEGPVSSGTMMRLASMTKPIVSVAALQLIEQGAIELEQPVRDILPRFGALQVLEGFDGETPRLRAPARQATIRNLLTHTSGLGYWFVNGDALRYHRLTGLPDPSSGSLAAFDMPLVADPGTRWEYGTSIDWLGLVVEAVGGLDLPTYCERHIFAPLAMVDATFRPSEEQRSRMMVLHARLPDGSLGSSSVEMAPERPEFWSGGSGAFATAQDYLRFLRGRRAGRRAGVEIRDRGARLLRPSRRRPLASRDALGGARVEQQRSLRAIRSRLRSGPSPRAQGPSSDAPCGYR
jgi:methyl acetate hydrolase